MPSAKSAFPAGREALAWRGADDGMMLIAIQEALDAKAVDWMAKVSDEHYLG